MPRKQAEKIANIKDRKHEQALREGKLLAEVLAKSNPSPEAKAYADGKFDADPSWGKFGDLTAEAMNYALDKFWLGYATKEGVRRAAERLKTELGYADASPVERMMIEHAVACHVRLGMMEFLYSRHGSDRMDIIEHWEKRLTLAQKRFTRAVTTLARVRGLLARAEDMKERSRKPAALKQVG
jgi:hypothetical protein